MGAVEISHRTWLHILLPPGGRQTRQVQKEVSVPVGKMTYADHPGA